MPPKGKKINLIRSTSYKQLIFKHRDIYYQHKHLFSSQIILDSYINDLARTINVPRIAFNIVYLTNFVLIILN